MRRRRANKRVDRKVFSATASPVNGKNLTGGPMRGGYRF